MGVRERNLRVVRLKEELQLMLDLLVHARESLENELTSRTAQKREFIDSDFLRKFKELASTFNSLTDARIRLDKSERTLENELSPEEEKLAVRDFILGLEPRERGQFLQKLLKFHNDNLELNTPKSRQKKAEDVQMPTDVDAPNEP